MTATATAVALDAAVRTGRAWLVAVLAARLGGRDAAEDAVQHALAEAARVWPVAGVPASPAAWLTAVARRRGIDARRRAAAQGRRAAALALLRGPDDPVGVPDTRLRLILACCHPALDPKSRVALTLRTVCGLDTRRVARAFLDTEAAMAQRLTRARARIARLRLRLSDPGPDDWAERLGAVLATIRLIYTAGYAQGPRAGADLAEEGVFLARLTARLCPDHPEVEGVLALVLLTQARAGARVADGVTVPPAAQDRARWDHALIAEGRAVLARAVARRAPGPYQIQAAIADCHLAQGGPDWPQIAALTTRLRDFDDTPVTRLSQAVAWAETGRLGAALTALAALGADLAEYPPWHAARAALLARAAQVEDARAAYAQAIARAESPGDAAYLAARQAELITNRAAC